MSNPMSNRVLSRWGGRIRPSPACSVTSRLRKKSDLDFVLKGAALQVAERLLNAGGTVEEPRFSTVEERRFSAA